MRLLRVICAFVAAGVALLALAGSASAQTCSAGCGLQKSACLRAGRVTKLTCKLNCRQVSAPTDLGACQRACTDQFRAAKDVCRTDHVSCLGSCPPAPPPSSCTGAFLDTCGPDLGTCARGVVAQVKTCARSCRTASDRLACLAACAAAVQAGAATCASDFQACLAGCGVPPPPGSTTTTSLPPVPSCTSAAAPTCGGTCPTPRQVCVPVTPTLCACLGG